MRAAFALRIISGKNIYNFAILENLRIFQNCLFTGGVVTESSICSAAFCESAALRETNPQLARPLSQSLSALPALPKGEPLAVHADFISLPRPLPLGEVDLRSKDGEGEDACLRGFPPPFCEKNHRIWQGRQAKTKNPHQRLLYRTKDVQNS